MVLVKDYSGMGSAQLVEGMRKAWRRNFSGSALDPELWTVISKGAGQTITVAGGALAVNQGVGINEETVIRSVARFQIPFRVQFSATISQRIAQNEIYFELVNAAGNTYAGWMFDGTVVTTAKTTHMNNGASAPASPTAGITVTTSAAPLIHEIDARIDMVEFVNRTVDSNALATSRATKTRTVLDPYEDYFIQMRFKNTGGIAPASGTITTLETILVQDTNDVLVEVSGGRGGASSGKGIPVSVLNQATTQFPSATASTTSSTALNAFRNPALSNVSSTVKAAAGKLYLLAITNPSASAAYFNVYNSTAPVIGTTVPTFQFWLQPNETQIVPFDSYGVNFTVGITVAATDTSAVLSAVAPVTPLVVNALHL